jgi:hypothetical protein
LASSEDRGRTPVLAKLATRENIGCKNSEILNMYPNHDAIFERLEMTKQFGLLSDYFVSWTGRSGRLRAKVTIWGKDGTPAYVIRPYIARLLKGLVPARQISIAADDIRRA